MDDDGHPVTSGCSCREHGVTMLDDLDDLMRSGVDQWTASMRLWGGPVDSERADPSAGDESGAHSDA